jgi:hypothetical protein
LSVNNSKIFFQLREKQLELPIFTSFFVMQQTDFDHDRTDQRVRPLIDCKSQARGLDLARFLGEK